MCKKGFLILLMSTALSVNFCCGIKSFAQAAAKGDVSTAMAGHHGGNYPTYPTIHYGTGPQADSIKRGEILVKAGDCISCHTAETPNAVPFAGGLPIDTPFGTIYTPNITPDKETGIGQWTDKQFIDAVRRGVNPRGSFYYPAFPYLYFSQMSDEDVLAIKAYLNAIPPVHQKNKENKMMFPFNFRFLQFFWRVMFFYAHDEPLKPDPNQSVAWNRGRLLVQGPGHCGMCHTPMYDLFTPKLPLAAPIRKYDLTGAMVQGFYAPNITSTELKGQSIQDIVDVFEKGTLFGGKGEVAGPMLEVVHNSLQYIPKDDLDAIATYLQTVKSETPPAPRVTKNGGAGQGVYEAHCAACHGTGAAGAPVIGSAEWAPLVQLGLNELYKRAINGYNAMPAKGTCMSCSNQDIQEAVQYMVDQYTEKGKAPGAVAPSGIVSETDYAKLTSVQVGEKIYQHSCYICHDTGALGAPKLGDTAAWTPLVNKGMPALFTNTMKGYNVGMPPRGACAKCTNADLIAAVKYMVEKSGVPGQYQLW